MSAFEFNEPSANKLVGFDIDLHRSHGREAWRKSNWIESSWNQMTSFSDIKTKRADLTVGIGDTRERRKSV
ncbi:transporter substrate-binding domain-containing protein [Bradyrhizobium brasilense]|uniref:transporter substrate-binding domain-containing protein n=1 Tax=Bradyrhizobium brasilense TaxID=1419277 RepID=UPI0014567630|nr:transporter substrate-binding domain-containing protein [Bradyrhizobium brasilense]